MSIQNKFNKKVIAITLSIGIIASSLSPVLVTFAKEGVEAFKLPFNNDVNVNPKESLAIAQSNEPVAQENIKDQIISPDDKDSVLYKGTKKTLPNGEELNHGCFNLSHEELEEMIQKGYSIQDIFQADEIGNRINEDPKKLLEKKNEGIDLAEVENDILSKRMKDNIQKLKEKHLDSYNEIKGEGLSEGDELALLAFIDKNDVNSVRNLVNEYKQVGQEAFKNHTKSKEKIVSMNKMKKNGLTENEVEGLSDEMLDKFEFASQNSGIPVKELVKGYKEQLEKQKGGEK